MLASTTEPDWGYSGELENVSGEIAIVGVGDAIYQRASGKNANEIALDAIERAIADAGLRPDEVDGIMQSPLPYVTEIVTLEEDARVRYVTRIVDVDPTALQNDQPMEVVFRTLTFKGVGGRVEAPVFRPVR